METSYFQGHGEAGPADKLASYGTMAISVDQTPDGGMEITVLALANMYMVPHAKIILDAAETRRLGELLTREWLL